jgi:Rha family phage regulatory protein
MKNLVEIKNGQAVTDSLTVAEVFGKDHDKVVRDIKVQIDKLFEAGEAEFSRANFGGSNYEARGKTYHKFVLSEDAFALVAMSYTTPEAMKFKVKFLQEFKRIKEELQGKAKPLSDREQLLASMKLTIEMSEEFGNVKKDVDELKDKVDNQMTLDYGQQLALSAAKNKRVEKLWDEMPYNDVIDTKRKLHGQAWKDLKFAFGVASYRDIKRKDFTEAVNYVNAWRPRMFGGVING